MAPPRKTGAHAAEADDPERENKTQTRAPAPVEDPEAGNATQARAPNPLGKGRAAKDPEQENKTQARAPRPTGKRSKSTADEEYKTGSEYGADESAEYKTGQGYEAVDEPLAGELSLEGDGLEALDPEVGAHTKALPALERDEAPPSSDDDDEGADEANATRAGPPMKLEIVAGPDAGKKKKFKGVRMVIGRTPGVDLQLSDQSVSRRHVELIAGDGGVVMRDLGSGNGTKVNGSKVAEKTLEHGDEIHIGKTKIRFVDEVAAFNKARELAEKKEAEAKAKAEAAKAERAAAAEAKKAEATAAAAAAAAAPEADPTSANPAPSEGDEPLGGKADEKTGITTRPVRDRKGPVRTSRGEPEATGVGAKWKALNPKLRLVIVGFAAIVVLIFIAGLLLKPPPPPSVDPSKVLADQKMQDARNAVKAGEYEVAVKLIDEAEKLLPGIDKTKLGNQARDELAYTHALDEARTAIGERHFDDARKALDRTGKGSGRNEEAKAKVRAELDAAEVIYKREKIDEFIAAGEIEAAKATLATLPSDQYGDAEQKITEYERQLEEQNKKDDAQQRQQNANAAAAARARRAEEIAEAFTTVERKFGGGEWDRAASECNRVVDDHSNDRDIVNRARALQTQIPNFGRAYDEGMKKYRQGVLAQASKPLRQAWQLYNQIGLKANRYGQDLEGKLGESSIAAGREALLRDDLVTAYTNFKDATRFDPTDSKARTGLLEVENKAEELFQFAYMQKDNDPKDALRKFKIVVQVTDPQSSTHEKAKNHIAALQP